MNATQGLIYYALRCRCRTRREIPDPRRFTVRFLDWLSRKTYIPAYAIEYVHHRECVACQHARADEEIWKLLQSPLQEYAAPACIAFSDIGRRVLDGYYSTTPASTDLKDAAVLAGSVPTDQKPERSEVPVVDRIAEKVDETQGVIE